ncbi:hypothetical protein [Pseudomonas sp. NPDC096950]|uniref:TRAFAC clade GTPase domain-containing protein n=1 Tax=Pseudomonas sp. NPDC096950 TaxID=3364485 RepID=UPI00383A7D74
MDVNAYGCSLAGCDGPMSGVCINGLNFEECPDVILILDAEEVSVPVEDSPRSSDLVSTRGFSSLDALSCDALLRARGGIVVGVVAGPEVGKTTMIATMYEMLHRGQISDAQFAGSETLRGYEERCHLARVASNGLIPNTARTPTSARLSFTHLRLATSKGIKDIIFSDRSGEHFDNVLDNPGSIVEFSELSRADIILLLVDIEHFLKTPHIPTSRIRRLLMTMDQQLLLAEKTVRLIGTKADLAKSNEELEAARSSLHALAADLSQRTGGRVQISPLLIAARPREGATQIAEGLKELLDEILKEPDPVAVEQDFAWPVHLTEMDKLMHVYRSKKR